MMINPGVFKHKMVILRNEIAKDLDGFKTSTITEVLSTKCAITGATFSDKTRSSGDEINSTEKTIKCQMRYSDKVNENCLVKIKDITYKIRSIENVNFDNKILELVLHNG